MGNCNRFRKMYCIPDRVMLLADKSFAFLNYNVFSFNCGYTRSEACEVKF